MHIRCGKGQNFYEPRSGSLIVALCRFLQEVSKTLVLPPKDKIHLAIRGHHRDGKDMSRFRCGHNTKAQTSARGRGWKLQY